MIAAEVSRIRTTTKTTWNARERQIRFCRLLISITESDVWTASVAEKEDKRSSTVPSIPKVPPASIMCRRFGMSTRAPYGNVLLRISVSCANGRSLFPMIQPVAAKTRNRTGIAESRMLNAMAAL